MEQEQINDSVITDLATSAMAHTLKCVYRQKKASMIQLIQNQEVHCHKSKVEAIKALITLGNCYEGSVTFSNYLKATSMQSGLDTTTYLLYSPNMPYGSSIFNHYIAVARFDNFDRWLACSPSNFYVPDEQNSSEYIRHTLGEGINRPKTLAGQYFYPEKTFIIENNLQDLRRSVNFVFGGDWTGELIKIPT